MASPPAAGCRGREARATAGPLGRPRRSGGAYCGRRARCGNAPVVTCVRSRRWATRARSADPHAPTRRGRDEACELPGQRARSGACGRPGRNLSGPTAGRPRRRLRALPPSAARRGARGEQADAMLPAEMQGILDGGEPSLDAARRAAGFARSASGMRSSSRSGAAPGCSMARPRSLAAPGAAPRQGDLDGRELSRAQCRRSSRAACRPERTQVRPSAFLKLAAVLIGHEEPIPYPVRTMKLDYEVELVAVVGRRTPRGPVRGRRRRGRRLHDLQRCQCARRAARRDGEGNDPAREEPRQLRPDGPYLVTRDEIPDLSDLTLRLCVNGVERQQRLDGGLDADAGRDCELLVVDDARARRHDHRPARPPVSATSARTPSTACSGWEM